MTESAPLHFDEQTQQFAASQQRLTTLHAAIAAHHRDVAAHHTAIADHHEALASVEPAVIQEAADLTMLSSAHELTNLHQVVAGEQELADRAATRQAADHELILFVREELREQRRQIAEFVAQFRALPCLARPASHDEE